MHHYALPNSNLKLLCFKLTYSILPYFSNYFWKSDLKQCPDKKKKKKNGKLPLNDQYTILIEANTHLSSWDHVLNLFSVLLCTETTQGPQGVRMSYLG